VVSLRNNPAYVALSYVWGDATITPGTVSIDDHALLVTENLHAALRRLRWHAYSKDQAPLLIWADALCINQTDQKEKERQIPLMGKIYSKCEYTAVWLG
ncbi:heterokaryon incompatibility, partial [Lentithecium fluviatile CBS 122367]